MVCGMIATSAPVQLKTLNDSLATGTGFPISAQTEFPSRSGAIRSFFLAGPAGRLEAVLNEGAPNAPFAALVCHPHPVFGGNLHNRVVYHAMKALNDPAWGLGCPVLRFNFRGAGLSEGSHDGEAEVDDVLAALDWLRRELKRPLVAAGFSFGAAMALHACCRLLRAGNCEQNSGANQEHPTVRAIVALGLPLLADLPAYHYSFLQQIIVPKFFLSGDRDEFAPPDQLEQVVASAAEPKQLMLLSGADHFFAGNLEPMQNAIASWVKEQLQ
jgi:uncharacterized protein